MLMIPKTQTIHHHFFREFLNFSNLHVFFKDSFFARPTKSQSLYLKAGKFESHVIWEFEIGPTQQV